MSEKSGGQSEEYPVMVFRPTMDEFSHFLSYIKKIEAAGAHHSGLAKIIPPAEWNPQTNYDQFLDAAITSPIEQVVTGAAGVYQQLNVVKKSLSVREFRQLADSQSYAPPWSESYDDLERRYWKNMTFSKAIYGADVDDSVTDPNCSLWNFQKLPSILDYITKKQSIKIVGVNTPYLYYGMWKATFAWHTEDMDLYSINYIHYGAPKTWYAIPPEHGKRMETVAESLFPQSHQSCPNFLRHKMTIISPSVLRKNNIPVCKMVQEAGEMMVTFPYAYHQGFNHGFNCAEATNFATERWIEFGKWATKCFCNADAVSINMDPFVRIYQPHRYYAWISGRDQNKIDFRKLDYPRPTIHKPLNIAELTPKKSSFISSVEENGAPSNGKFSLLQQAEDLDLRFESDSSDECELEPRKRNNNEFLCQQSRHYAEIAIAAVLAKYQAQDAKSSHRPLDDTISESPPNPPSLLPGSSIPDSPHRSHHVKNEADPPLDSVLTVTTDANGGLLANSDDEVYVSPCKRQRLFSSLPEDGEWSTDDLLHDAFGGPSLSVAKSFNLSEAFTAPFCAICSIFRSHFREAARLLSDKQRRIKLKYERDGFKATRPLIGQSAFRKAQRYDPGHSACQRNTKLDSRKPCPILMCVACNLSVHATCYGVALGEFSDQWLCDPCSNGDFTAGCGVCPWEGGALKRVANSSNVWIHVVCALAIPEARFTQDGSCSAVDISLFNNSRRSLRCSICQRASSQSQACRPSNPCPPADPRFGCAVQCADDQCPISFHITCASGSPGFSMQPGKALSEPSIAGLCRVHDTKQSSGSSSSPDYLKMPFNHDTPLVAKCGNRYIRVQFIEENPQVLYRLLFDDGCVCDNLSPDGVLHNDWRNQGHPVLQSRLSVVWNDGKVYGAKLVGIVSLCNYTVALPDGTRASLPSERLHALDRPLTADLKKAIEKSELNGQSTSS